MVANLPAGGLTDDLFDGRARADPANTRRRSSATRCRAARSSGETVLVFKGATGEGDCAGSKKVFHAQSGRRRRRDS